MRIEKYNSSYKIVWDEFVSLAKNKHFFFYRDFMEYHSERFNDFSLMVFDNDKLVALLPANIFKNEVFSHEGLTFGGLIIKPTVKQKEVNLIFQSIIAYLNLLGVKKFIYKKIPYIYHSSPCDEDLYFLFLNKSMLIRRDVSSAIKLNNQIKYSKGRKWIIKKSITNGVLFSESKDIGDLWERLSNVLMSSHGVKPVHSFHEISALKNLFPNNIKFYSACLDGEQVAGAVIFITDTVAHTQYLYNSDRGREVGALDGLIDYLVKDIFPQKEYFDFGISNENKGLFLNDGLISQKEGFGARAIVHDFYEVNISD